jgi:competence protein ComEC
MTRRPLLVLLFVYAAGVVVGHSFLPKDQGITLPLLLMVFLLLSGGILLSSPFKAPLFLCTFFAVGLLMDLAAHPPESTLAQMARERKAVVVEGTLLEPPETLGALSRFTIRVEALQQEAHWLEVDGDLVVTVYAEPPVLRPGERIRFPASLHPFRNFSNPGGYDYVAAMEMRGLAGAASVPDGRRIVPMGQGRLSFPDFALEKIRHPVRRLLGDRIDPSIRGILAALILGERRDVSPSVREPFDKAGLGHIMAVSGLHIGIVAGAFLLLFRWLLCRSTSLMLHLDVHGLAAVLTCVPVVLYTAVAGFQVSAQRAMIMALCFLLSAALGRGKEVWSSLALAAIVTLFMDPHALFGISFQMSFGAVVGILFWTPKLLKNFIKTSTLLPDPQSIGARLAAYVWGLLAVSLAATLFVLPFSAYYFHRIPLVALPANLTAVPILGFLVIPAGLAGAALLPLFPSLAEWLFQLAGLGVKAMSAMAGFWSSLPFSSPWVVQPNGVEMALLYALLFILLFRKRIRWARSLTILLGLALCVDVTYWVFRTRLNRDLRVTFLDVGQANCALVEFPFGKRMLIDGGGFSSDHFDVGKMVVAPFLWRSKIGTIDYMILTHPQADHMNGLRFIASGFNPDEFWWNGETVETESFQQLMERLHESGAKQMGPSRLSEPRWINGVFVEVLHPPEGDPAVEEGGNSLNLNDRSLVIRISYQGISFLFPGDLEKAGEKVLLSRSLGSLRSHILLAPHHGSRSSCSEPFIRSVDPGLCVISCGASNPFGFPHPEILKRLADRNCQVLRTDQSGAILCTVDDRHGLTIQSVLGPPGSSQPQVRDPRL